MIEKWESPEALKAHAASPHMAAYGAKTRDMIASRVIHVLRPPTMTHRTFPRFAGEGARIPQGASRPRDSASTGFSTASDNLSTDLSS